jgi:CBS domain-containing protein
MPTSSSPSITVKQLLQKRSNEICSIAPDAAVFEALKEMEKHSVGALLVMEGEELVGILSERDYTRKIILKDRSSKKALVSEIMIKNPICIDHNQSIEECMKLMYSHNFRHLPALEDGKVIGLLTIKDVLGGILNEKEELIHQLENYISG